MLGPSSIGFRVTACLSRFCQVFEIRPSCVIMRNCNCQLSEIVVVVVSLVRKKYRNVESEAFVKHLCVY